MHHWHGLPRRARGESFEYRYKCILMSRSVSVFPPTSHFHITYLVPLINFVLLDSSRSRSNAIQPPPSLQPPRLPEDRPLSRSSRSFFPFLHSPYFISIPISLSPRIAFFSLFNRNSMLRVNIIESPRILGLLLASSCFFFFFFFFFSFYNSTYFKQISEVQWT